jgi:hypothetical protein
MKEPSRDVGRAEKTAVDPNEMQSLAENLNRSRRMTPQFASASEIPSRNRTAPTACFPSANPALWAEMTSSLPGYGITGT